MWIGRLQGQRLYGIIGMSTLVNYLHRHHSLYNKYLFWLFFDYDMMYVFQLQIITDTANQLNVFACQASNSNHAMQISSKRRPTGASAQIVQPDDVRIRCFRPVQYSSVHVCRKPILGWPFQGALFLSCSPIPHLRRADDPPSNVFSAFVGSPSIILLLYQLQLRLQYALAPFAGRTDTPIALFHFLNFAGLLEDRSRKKHAYCPQQVAGILQSS